MDKLFRVEVIAKTENPQQVIYQAMHQDYSEGFVADEAPPSEEKCGDIIVHRLLAGNKGHFGSCEHPSITLNCGYFPHSVMQQIRTHRVGISFDCQSNRYTSQRFLSVAAVIQRTCKYHIPSHEEIESQVCNNPEIQEAIDDVIYFRPVGAYTNRNGHSYQYEEYDRLLDKIEAAKAIIRYAIKLEQGLSPEHARGMMPFDVRQHWVMSLNVRSFMHLLDLRWKKDAQLECQQLCSLMWFHFESWVPRVAEWYLYNRAQKARLAP